MPDWLAVPPCTGYLDVSTVENGRLLADGWMFQPHARGRPGSSREEACR